eukprot:NODE_19_length_47148_cov_1.447810.p43 type:complete len:105 gc:universal NODE_19_length_47148_cov_1.447810:43959-44273(+)
MLCRILFGGRVTKISWKMNSTRRANHRKRLLAEDAVIKAVKDSGVELKSLDKIKDWPTYSQMSRTLRYFIFSKKSPNFLKGVNTVPHFTKVSFQRVMPKIVKQK